jgi:hypothetical protein
MQGWVRLGYVGLGNVMLVKKRVVMMGWFVWFWLGYLMIG